MAEYIDYFKNKAIYVFGYSNLGRNAYNKLEYIYGDKVKGILVSKRNARTECSSKNIIELHELNREEDVLVVIAINARLHDEIKEMLNKEGLTWIVYDETLDIWINKQMEFLPKLELKFLAVSVGQACNYKCRDCLNFAPLAKSENLRYTVSNVKRDLDRLLLFIDEIDTFHIQGGEPFLYSNLEELLTYIGEKYQGIIKKVQIATNGSIIPDEKVLKIIKRYGFMIRISNYKNEKNMFSLVNKLQEMEIPYKKYNFAGGTGEWKMGGDVKYCIPKTENLLQKVNECAWNSCYTIENSYVGRCARSIPAITLQDIELYDNDYIYLDRKNLQENVSRFFMFIKPMECCKHCKGSNGEAVQAAIQL